MRQRTIQMASEKSALPRIHEVDEEKTEKANRHRERSRQGRHKAAVKSAGEEWIAFNRGSQPDEVNLSQEAHRKAAKSGSTVENIHGKCEIGYHSGL